MTERLAYVHPENDFCERYRTYSTPVHERASSMRSSDGRERKGDIVRGLEVRYEVAAVQAAHGVGEEVNTS